MIVSHQMRILYPLTELDKILSISGEGYFAIHLIVILVDWRSLSFFDWLQSFLYDY